MMIFGIVCHLPAVAAERGLAVPIREDFGSRNGFTTPKLAVEHDQAKGFFIIDLARETVFLRQKIQLGVITPQNPLVMSLAKLSGDFLGIYRSSIDKLIDGEGLRSRLMEMSAAVGSDVLVKSLQQQLDKKEGEIGSIKKNLRKKKFDLASLELQKKHPAFSVLLLEEMSGKEREANIIKFFIKNNTYPSTEEAQKDYIALFIYQRWYILKNG
jgi:hypothetical protein